jgi:DNA-binding MarR family transcriptional regulator
VPDAAEFARLLRALGRDLARLEREGVCCGDWTLQQFDTLRLLQDAPDGLATSALAARLGIDLSTASRNFAILARDGYIRRARQTADGRQVTNHLTPKGRRCVESLCCDERMVFGGVFTRLAPSDREPALATLRALSRALAAAPDDEPAGTANCCPPARPKGASP